MRASDIHYDCRHWRGDLPCKPNKLRGRQCPGCDEYAPIKTRILIIKLGALGDVIRSTPLITGFRERYPGVHLTWITLSPEILPKGSVDTVLPLDALSIQRVRHTHYDIAVNLDKDAEACMLLAEVKSERKLGFIWKDGHIAPATPAAEHKLLTGAFDHLSKVNTKSYPQEIFEICEMPFNGEHYVFEADEALKAKHAGLRELAGGKPIVGLNTGCGKRWLTRLWPEDNWVELIDRLRAQGCFPVLLGGPDEDEMNRRLHARTKAHYPGTFPLREFIALTSHADVVVSAVSMMMHIAIGLRIPLILFVNIFNRHEFELYGKGTIVEPPTGCDCYYGNTCTRERHCMKDVTVQQVHDAINAWLPR